jgi:hypothetical protein
MLRGEVGARALRVRSVSREEEWASAGVQGAWVSGSGCEADWRVVESEALFVVVLPRRSFTRHRMTPVCAGNSFCSYRFTQTMHVLCPCPLYFPSVNPGPFAECCGPWLPHQICGMRDLLNLKKFCVVCASPCFLALRLPSTEPPSRAFPERGRSEIPSQDRRWPAIRARDGGARWLHRAPLSSGSSNREDSNTGRREGRNRR